MLFHLLMVLMFGFKAKCNVLLDILVYLNDTVNSNWSELLL